MVKRMPNVGKTTQIFCVCFVILCVVACSKEEAAVERSNFSTLSANGTQTTAMDSATPAASPSLHSPSPDIMSYPDRKAAEEAKKLHRKGEIQMENIENAGVEGALLETVMALLEAVKNKDEATKLKLHYDPSRLTFDAVVEPFIHAVTRIELDNTDLELMMDGYDFYSEAAIVKITTTRLNRNGNEYDSTGNFIFVKVDGNWLVYRTY